MAKTINLENALRPWQKEYIKNKKRFNVIVVHRRGGKTVSAVLDCIIVGLKEKGDYGYIAPTYRQAKKIAWRMIQKFGDQIGGFQYNASELIVSFNNGSTLSLFGAENPDSLRGLDLKGVIFDEYAQQPSNIYGEIVFPMINANKGWVTWIGTPKGKNSFFKLYERAVKDERFYTALLKYSDTNLLDAEQIADAREEMTEEEFEQEYNCSWQAYMRGSVYGKELARAYEEGRVKKDIYDETLETYTFWDLGVSDAMTILFVQVLGKEIRIIDSYKNTGYGLDHYAEVVNNKPYKYKTHYFPHDIRQRELSTGMSRIETAIKLLGKNCDIVPMNTIESGINAGRLIFKHLWINEDMEDFINDISLYQYEWDDKLGEFKKTPKHDWTSHTCFTSGTKIHTLKGIKNIEDIKFGDIILTKKGFRKAVQAGPTKITKILKCNFENGEQIESTLDHPFSCNGEYKKLDTISYLDNIDTISYLNTIIWKQGNLINVLIDYISEKNITTTVTDIDYIEMYGFLTSEKYRHDMTSIIKMGMLRITIYIILKGLNRENIEVNIGKKDGKMKILEKIIFTTSLLPKKKQRYGTKVMMVIIGIRSIIKIHYEKWKKNTKNVRYAKICTKQNKGQEADFAQTIVSLNIVDKIVLITLKCLALFVVVCLQKINILLQKPVTKIVQKYYDPKQCLVYNLSVEGEHNYFANGCLVHNCDAYRYLATIFEHLMRVPIIEQSKGKNEDDPLDLFIDDFPDEDDIELQPY